MRLLPILWSSGYEPSAEDWTRLSEARIAIGYTDLIQPAAALPGSPQPVLAIGCIPTWVTDYAYVESAAAENLEAALSYCLEMEHPAEDLMAKLLSSWMGCTVKYVGSEEHDGGVQFA